MLTIGATRRLLPLLVVPIALVAGLFVGVNPAAAAGPGQIGGTVGEAGTGPSVPLGGLTVTFDDGSVTPPTAITASDGTFAADLADGQYDVFVDGGDDHADWYREDVNIGAGAAPSVDLGQILLDRGQKIRGTVRDAATGAGVAGVAVDALGASGDFTPARPFTDDTGRFAITVPLTEDDYLVAALDDNSVYYPQYWDHLLLPSALPCNCGFSNTVHVGDSGGADLIDFDLYSYTRSIYFSVQTRKADGQLATGFEVFLEKDLAAVPGTHDWRVVNYGTSDESGVVDLFALGDGDYRLAVKEGPTLRVITRAVEVSCSCGDAISGGTVYPLTVSDTRAQLGDLNIQPDIEQMASYVEVDLTLKKRSAGGGSTVNNVLSFDLTTPTPAVTPEPIATAIPTPPASVTASEQAGPSPSPSTDAGTSTSVDLWWLWLLIGLVLLGIVITIVVFIRRR